MVSSPRRLAVAHSNPCVTETLDGMRKHTQGLDIALASTDWALLLPLGLRERLLAECFLQDYAAKDVVASRGEVAGTWIGVLEGLMKVCTVAADGRSVMFTAVPFGSWVGEGSVIKREPRRYDLLALRPTRVIHVPRSTFMWLLEESIEFNRFIIDHLNERAGQFIEMLEVSRITDPVRRLAGAVGNLFNPILAPKLNNSMLKISQEELGELAGLSRSSINIGIKKLRTLRLVHSEYGGIVILDMPALRRFVYIGE